MMTFRELVIKYTGEEPIETVDEYYYENFPCGFSFNARIHFEGLQDGSRISFSRKDNVSFGQQIEYENETDV